MAYFKSQFKRQVSENGKYIYWFDSVYTQNDNNRNEVPPFAIDGITIESNTVVSREDLLKLPEEVQNPMILKKVFTQWINDCSGAFVKCPSIEQCLSRSESMVDPNATLATIFSEEEEESWTLQWIPIRIKVDTPIFELYWSPCYKIPSKSRIPIDDIQPEINLAQEPSIDVQNPEKTYTILPPSSRRNETDEKEWIQEMADLHVPFADSTTLRLDSELDNDSQKEKLRRKIRDARIRAKLARYRAERMAFKFEEKYGFYPEEDAEEAETEIDSGDEIS
jgi:hypothetical protein